MSTVGLPLVVAGVSLLVTARVRECPLGEETLRADRFAVAPESLGVERTRSGLRHDSKATSANAEVAAGIVASTSRPSITLPLVTAPYR
jgi:hypothetical protein